MPKMTLREALAIQPRLQQLTVFREGERYLTISDTEAGERFTKADGRPIGRRAAIRLRQAIPAKTSTALAAYDRAHDKALLAMAKRSAPEARPEGLDAQLAQLERRLKALEVRAEEHDRSITDLEEGREEVAQIAEALRLFAK